MSSIGIPEGKEWSGDPCTCRVTMLTSLPPKFRLEKKCDHCKEKERENGNQINRNIMYIQSLVEIGVLSPEQYERVLKNDDNLPSGLQKCPT